MVPVAHFAVGMAPPFAVTAALLPTKKRWLIYAPLVITFCGFWSLVPDMPVFFGREFHRDEMRRFMHEKVGDLFFFHKTLDRLGGELYNAQETQRGGVWGLAMVVFMYFCVVIGYILYIRRLLAEIMDKKAVIRALSGRSGGGQGPR